MIFYTKIRFNQPFIEKTPCSFVYRGDFGKILCVEQRAPPPPQPHHPASCHVIEYALL
jgi:hypothetical protein